MVKKIFDKNRKWVAKQLGKDEDYFSKLAKQQKPEYLYIGCSDSRVIPESIMGFGCGELFVHRNIGNLVSNTDLNVMSVINYAVCHLKVKHIIVCGHTHCGGVEAAMTAEDFGVLNPWLRNIRDVYRLHREELEAIDDEDKKKETLVEFNVREQCFNLVKVHEVQEAIVERGLNVHGWVFDIATGKLKDLEIEHKQMLKEIQSVFPKK